MLGGVVIFYLIYDSFIQERQHKKDLVQLEIQSQQQERQHQQELLKLKHEQESKISALEQEHNTMAPKQKNPNSNFIIFGITGPGRMRSDNCYDA